MKNIWVIIGIVAVVAIGASIVYSNNSAEKANEGVVITPHIKGGSSAKVVIVEHSDFQCPACGQFFPVVQEVLEEHGDAVSLEYRHFPLVSIHPFAVPAAKAAEAAGQQDKFWEMHDKLFENQQVWSASTNPQSYFNTYAEELGLDVALFKQHMKASLIDDAVQAGFEEARQLGLTGTPSFYLNGERMDFSTFQDFKDQINTAVNGTDVSEASSTPATDSGVKFGL